MSEPEQRVAMIPVYLDPLIVRSCNLTEFLPASFWTTMLIKRKYGKHPEVRIDKLEFKKYGLKDYIPRVKNTGMTAEWNKL